MWNLILYIVAVVIGLVLYHTYDENEENEECTSHLQDGSSSEVSEKRAVSDFRFSSLFAVLGFSVPGETSEECFDSFAANFSTFDEVIIAPKGHTAGNSNSNNSSSCIFRRCALNIAKHCIGLDVTFLSVLLPIILVDCVVTPCHLSSQVFSVLDC